MQLDATGCNDATINGWIQCATDCDLRAVPCAAFMFHVRYGQVPSIGMTVLVVVVVPTTSTTSTSSCVVPSGSTEYEEVRISTPTRREGAHPLASNGSLQLLPRLPDGRGRCVLKLDRAINRQEITLEAQSVLASATGRKEY